MGRRAVALERLQKVMARAGIASRRRSEELIVRGVVTVNGERVTQLGMKVDPERDVIEVNKKPLNVTGRKTYLALNKPVGFITTLSDPFGRPTIKDLIDFSSDPGLFPVGRLDQDSEGLLLITNDGELTYRLTHPRYGVLKVYEVEVGGRTRPDELLRLREGVMLEDGPTAPAEVTVLKERGDSTLLSIGIREGKKREIRRMCQKIGHPVIRLKRTAFGPVKLGRLAEGSARPLSEEEVAALRMAVGLTAEDAQADVRGAKRSRKVGEWIES
ncbi:MAG: rRNA pseudouridine synthase [Actinobacteria bacterium]|nr:MAG: rRNA pseudouridine synthase [Actinomycetota bacterium]